MPDRHGPSARVATLWYTLATLVTTWPLPAGLFTDIPWDLGDSILNAWILQWGADHILQVLGGHPGALAGYWSPGIFYPEPLALAYSEHLTAQVLQVLPFYAATGNIVFAYNVLFLSTFVLSGLGMFLLVREWSGNPRAGLVAGFVFAFLPYRVAQFSHIQVLSAQWMPLVLYGLARYARERRWQPLALASAALLANNLSCGYYLLYFAPFAAAFAVWELARQGLWRQPRAWGSVLGAGALAAALTAPFLLPYAALRARGFEPRPMQEVVAFSADVYGYLTTHPLNRLWGSAAQAFPRAEGELFPGLAAAVLVLVAVAVAIAASLFAETAGVETSTSRGRRLRPVAAWIAGLVCALQVALLAAMALAGRISVRAAGVSIRASSPGRTLVIGLVAFAALTALSPRVRAALGRAWRSPLAISLAALLAAWVLSLGPRPGTLGRPFADWGPYAWLHLYVPGFDGLRVPARFGMLVGLFGAVAAGYGAAAIDRWTRGARWAVAALAVVILAESTAAPIVVNGMSPIAGYVTPEGPLKSGGRTDPVYAAVARLPAQAVLVEFPFGVDDYELRYMFASASHRRPLLNGYTGGFPLSYIRHRAAFSRVLSDPETAWTMLSASGATHAVVHEGAWLDGTGARVSAWLRDRGATEVGVYGTDALFRLERPGG